MKTDFHPKVFDLSGLPPETKHEKKSSNHANPKNHGSDHGGKLSAIRKLSAPEKLSEP